MPLAKPIILYGKAKQCSRTAERTGVYNWFKRQVVQYSCAAEDEQKKQQKQQLCSFR